MKKLLLIGLCLCLSTAYGQSVYDKHFDKDEIAQSCEARKKIMDDWKVRARTTYTAVYKHGALKDSFLSEKDEYGENGRQQIFQHFNRKGAQQSKTEFIYNEDWRITTWRRWEKGKLDSRQLFSYDEQGNKTEEVFFFKNGEEPAWRKQYAYDSGGKLLENTFVSSKKNKVNRRWVYEYYPNGKKKAINEYDHKGKLISAISYECKVEGQTVEQVKKDTSRYCIRYEDDGHGNEVKIVEERPAGKKTGRVIYKYSKAGNLLESVKYDHKGRQQYRYKQVFSDDSKLLEHVLYNGDNTMASRYTYEYSEDGMNNKRSFFKQGQLMSVSYNAYEFLK